MCVCLTGNIDFVVSVIIPSALIFVSFSVVLVRVHMFCVYLCEQTIDGVKEKLSVLDLVVLLILHQTKHRKAVESLVRNKIRSGAITETLLQTLFTNHSQVSMVHVSSLIQLKAPFCFPPSPENKIKLKCS